MPAIMTVDEHNEYVKKKKKTLLPTSQDTFKGVISIDNYNFTSTRNEKSNKINKKESQTQNKFFNTGAFENGYQFGDVTKTILGTGSDLVLNAAKGIANIGVSAAKVVAGGVAETADLIGQDKFANRIRNNIKTKESPVIKTINNLDNKVNKYSVSGEYIDKVAELMGYTAGLAAGSSSLTGITGTASIGSNVTGATLSGGNIGITLAGHTLNLPTLALIGGASGGYEEALSKDETSAGERWAKAISGGLIEGTTEGLFGMLGVGGNDLTDALGEKFASKFSSGAGKILAKLGVSATGESAEEFLSYAGNWLVDNNIIDKLGNADFKSKWNWEEVGEQMALAFASSALSQGGASLINTNSAIKSAENQLGRKLSGQEKVQVTQAVIEGTAEEKINKIKNNQNESVNFNNAQSNNDNKKIVNIPGLQLSNNINNFSTTNNITSNLQNQNNKVSQENNIFSQQVDEVLNGTYPKGNMLIVSENTPKILQDIGLKNLPITLTQRHLKTITSSSGNYKGANYHNLGIDLVKQLPNAIANPLNVLKSDTKSDSIVVITELADNQDRPIVASIKIDGKGIINDIEIDSNVMTSAYGRNNYDKFMRDNIAKGNLLYDIDEGIIKRSDGKLQLRPITSSTNNNSTINQKSQIAPLPINSNMQQNQNNANISRNPLKTKVNSYDVLSKSAVEFAMENADEINKLSDFNKEFSNMVKDDKVVYHIPPNRVEAFSDNSNDINKIAKILDSKPETISKQNKLKKWAATKILDKGYYIDKIARQYNNRELSAKYDYSLLHNGIANQIIGNGRFDSNGNKIGKSLYEIFDPIEQSNLVSEFSDYIYNKLNVDRMTLSERYNEDNKPVFGQSVTGEHSAKVAYNYEQKYPQFIEWAKQIYDYNNANLKMLADNGVISQGDIDYYNQKYPHYVPIVRDNDYTRNGMIKTDGLDLTVGSPIKTAKGGHSNIIPLKDAMAMRTMQTVSSALKNDFGHELLMTIYGDNFVDMFNEKGNIDDVVEDVTSNEIIKPKENGVEATFTIFDGGRKLTIPISEELFEALSPRNSVTFKPLNKLNNIRRALLTEYNPTFIITNPIKDIQDGLINSKHPKSFIKNIPEALRQIKTNGKIYQLYLANGGGQDTYFNYDKGTQITKKKMYMPTGNKFLDTIKIPLKVLDSVSSLNEVIEMTPRLSEFISSIDSGDSLQTAMYNAQEVTTNFKRGGDVTKNLDRNGATFLNAGVQGFSKQIRNIQDAKVNGIRGITNLVVKGAVAALPSILINGLIWKDDKDYAELSTYIKDNYYIIGKFGNNKFIRIPKGRVTSLIQKMFEEPIKALKGKPLDIDGFTDLLKNQVLPSDPTESNLITPLIQAFGTENGEAWYGGDIVPARLQNLPNGEQYDESIDSISIWLGKTLNISPYKINYVLDQYSGAIGDYILPYLTQESESPTDNPLGKLIAPISDKFSTDSTLKNQNITDFYDLSDKLQKKSNSAYASNEDKLRYMYVNSISKEMSELYKEKREIQNKNIKDSEKYNQSKKIQSQINELAKNGLANYNNVKVFSNYSKVSDKQFYLDSQNKWKEIDEKELKEIENLNMTLEEKNEYFKNRLSITKIKSDKTKSSAEIHLEVANTLIESNLSDKNIAYLYGKYYSSEEKLNALVSLNIPIKEYLKVDSADIEGKYNTKTGKTISGSKKNEYIKYVNGLNLNIPQKAILIKMNYNSYDTYNGKIINYVNKIDINLNEKKVLLKTIGFENFNKDIVNYINSQNLSAKQKEEKLKNLGFTIRDGRVYW